MEGMERDETGVTAFLRSLPSCLKPPHLHTLDGTTLSLPLGRGHRGYIVPMHELR